MKITFGITQKGVFSPHMPVYTERTMKIRFDLEKMKKRLFAKPLWELSQSNSKGKDLSLNPIQPILDLGYMDFDRNAVIEDVSTVLSESQADALEPHSFFDSNLLCLIGYTEDNEKTVGHSQRVAKYTLLLTQELGIEDEEFLAEIEKGAVLHDIGKIGIPKSILTKNASLTESEMDIIKEHPLTGYEMIEEFDSLKRAARVVLFHHERFDGRGYPYGLTGRTIPIEARIFAMADTLDAITSDRPYRNKNTFDAAYAEVERERGRQFDPQIADVFLSIPQNKWQEIRAETENAIHFVNIP